MYCSDRQIKIFTVDKNIFILSNYIKWIACNFSFFLITCGLKTMEYATKVPICFLTNFLVEGEHFFRYIFVENMAYTRNIIYQYIPVI